MFTTFLRTAPRFSCGRAGLPCTIRLAPAVPCYFPGHDRFAPPDRSSYVLIFQSFRQSAGNVFPVFHGQRLARRGHVFSCRLACRESFSLQEDHPRQCPTRTLNPCRLLNPIAWTVCDQDDLVQMLYARDRPGHNGAMLMSLEEPSDALLRHRNE
jgi:hypothetical protein